MEDRSHMLVAIAFVVLLAGATAAGAWWLMSGPDESEIYRIETGYGVSGLSAEAPVQYKGVRVGSVAKVELDPADRRRVRITIRLVPKTLITGSTYAQIATKGLTGMTIVALDDTGQSETPLATSATEPAQIPMRRGMMQSLEHSGRQLLAQANEVTAQLDDLLAAQNRKHVAEVLAQLDEATRRLVALEEGMLPAVERLPELAQESRELVERLRADARTLREVGGSTEVLTQQLSSDALPRVDALIADLEQTVEHVDALARELRRAPSSVVFGQETRPAPGPGEPGFEAPGGKAP